MRERQEANAYTSIDRTYVREDRQVDAGMYTYICIRTMYVYHPWYVCTYVCVYVFMCVRMYVCALCMYVLIDWVDRSAAAASHSLVSRNQSIRPAAFIDSLCREIDVDRWLSQSLLASLDG